MTEKHTFEIFSANCPLCKNVEIQKHQECEQIIYNVNNMTSEIKEKMKKYDIKAVPTTVIDGKYRITGIPDFPLVCDDDLFKRLHNDAALSLGK